jgi:hypothetical protein
MNFPQKTTIFTCDMNYNQGYYEGFASGCFVVMYILTISFVIAGIYYTYKTHLLIYNSNVLVERIVQHRGNDSSNGNSSGNGGSEEVGRGIREENPSDPHED